MSLVSKQTTAMLGVFLALILPMLSSSQYNDTILPCRNSSYLEEIPPVEPSENGCTFLSDEICQMSSLCPPKGTTCNECSCLFNYGNCQSDYPGHCLDIALSLGFNCGRGESPVEYIVAALNHSVEDEVNRTVSLCLLRRICDCLSRKANHAILENVEELCRSLCVLPDASDTTLPARANSSMSGILNGDDAVCDSVHSQYCRRHRNIGRTTDCARVCVQENSCERLIEGILEDEFEQNDLVAVLSVMSEFRRESNHPQHVRDVLKTHSSFYRAIQQNSTRVISHLNNTNSEMLMSLFDDLLSEERQEEWTELQEEKESPGQETLKRIETTSDLLGRSHQLRMAVLEQSPNFYYRGTNIEMNVECGQLTTGYEHVFSKDAALFLPAAEAGGDSCSRIISAALSSNLGDYITSSSNDSIFVNTDIMTVQAVAMNSVDPLSDIRVTFRSLNTSNELSNITCVYWDTTQSQWSTEGVVLMSENGTHYTCQSTHLTSFAVLVSVTPTQVISSTEAIALDTVTYIGVSISIICLLLTLFGLVAFRKVLNKGILMYVHFNLFLALLLALIVFITGIQTATRIKWLCSTVAAALHYLFLSVFCWMLAEGIMLYTLIVRVFNRPLDKWYYLLPLGWGVPIPIVAVSLALRHEQYGTASFCWLSVDEGAVWSFVGPLIAVILVNTIILALTICSIVHVKRKAAVNMNKNNIGLIVTSVKTTIVLLPLLGITWLVGLFAVSRSTTVFSWTFTILNSLQGLMIFVLRNNKVRIQLLKMCGLHSNTLVGKTDYSNTAHEYTSTSIYEE